MIVFTVSINYHPEVTPQCWDESPVPGSAIILIKDTNCIIHCPYRLFKRDAANCKAVAKVVLRELHQDGPDVR